MGRLFKNKSERATRKEARKARREERKENRNERREERKEVRADRKEERRNAVAGKNFFEKIGVHTGITVKHGVEAVGVGVRHGVETVKDTQIAQYLDNKWEGHFRKIDARVWPVVSGRVPSSFPEHELTEVMARPNVAVCFSGGGSRSATASLGEARGLHQLGLWDRVRYLGSNSGGTWFAWTWSFLPSHYDDNQFLGNWLPPEQIVSADQLKKVNKGSLFGGILAREAMWTKLIANNFLGKATKPLDFSGKDSSKNWSNMIAGTFLRPFALYSGDTRIGRRLLVSWSQNTVNQSLQRNKFLEKSDFTFVEKNRPYPIAVSALGDRGFLSKLSVAIKSGSLGTIENIATSFEITDGFKTDTDNYSMFELSPLYSGAGWGNGRHPWTASWIENIALDSARSESKAGGIKSRWLMANNRTTLADFMGFSSSATAIIAGLGSPLVNMPNHALNGDWKTFTALDGGYFDNQALIPMLRRKVPKIVAFMNSGYDPVEKDNIVEEIRQYFGDSSEKGDIANTLSWKIKQVFANNFGELDRLKDSAIENAKSRGVAFHIDRYRVVENTSLGVEPYEVEVFWVFMSNQPVWKDAIQRVIASGSDLRGKDMKHLENLPNYKTAKLNVSDEEVAILSSYTTWNVFQIEPELRLFLS